MLSRFRPRNVRKVALILGLLALSVYLYRSGLAERQSPRAEISDKEVIDKFYKIWWKTHAVFQNRWLGIPTLQHPFDVWITQEIFWEVKPDFVVETGTLLGGSAILWATIMAQINPKARVITIDVADKTHQYARNNKLFRQKVDFVKGSSTDPKVVAEVTRRVRGRRVVVILDSLHTKEHVLNELRAYAPLVNVGSYLIVQDSFAWHPTPVENIGPDDGPWDAIAAFMEKNDEFEIDSKRERLILTSNRNGFLRRVK